jgi:PAS domain S-box-containing protein
MAKVLGLGHMEIALSCGSSVNPPADRRIRNSHIPGASVSNSGFSSASTQPERPLEPQATRLAGARECLVERLPEVEWSGVNPALRLQGAALNANGDGIVITDRQGKVVWSNPAFARLTGYPGHEMAGRNIRFLKSGEHDARFFARMWETILAGEIWRGELINRHKRGGLFAQQQTITPLRDRDGSIACFIGTSIAQGKGAQPSARALRNQQMLAAERTRLARDMHDGLGASLTRLKVLSERIEQDLSDPQKVMIHARLIADTSRELARSLDEIVWAVNPQKDRLENLVSYLTAYADEFLGLAKLPVRLEVPETLPDIPVPAQTRQYLFLAFKEALNNVVRHAHASMVWVQLVVRSGQLVLRVRDNGCGFTLEQAPVERNGMKNMRSRLAEAGGACAVESRRGAGTTVEMVVSL